MRHLDDGHAGVVERGHDRADVLFGELVALGVRAVAQAGVGHTKVECVGVRHGLGPPCCSGSSALRFSSRRWR